MTASLHVLSRIAAAACLAASCAKPATQDARVTRTNPHVAPLAAQQAKWRSHHLLDYAFVMDRHSMVRDISSTRLRVVVVQGRVQAASSALYGGSVALSLVPTIDALFERAQRAAQLGPHGVPHHFEATYDPTYGVPMHVWSNPRSDLADEETGFDLSCFSADPSGCPPVLITTDQCAAAAGRVVNIATEHWCGANSAGSIGLVNAADACCRDWQPDGTDGLTAEQCERAGGRIAACGDRDISVGTVHASGLPCCRPLVN